MRRPDLVSDCRSCDALCCVATSFEASEDFAVSKPSGTACPHLSGDRSCAIHDQRIERGFLGCTLFECYGAGPKLTRALAADSCSTSQRTPAFLALRTVHELLWQLTEAAKLCPASHAELYAEMAREVARLDAIAQGPTSVLIRRDLAGTERTTHGLLRRLGDALGGRRSLRVLPST